MDDIDRLIEQFRNHEIDAETLVQCLSETLRSTHVGTTSVSQVDTVRSARSIERERTIESARETLRTINRYR